MYPLHNIVQGRVLITMDRREETFGIISYDCKWRNIECCTGQEYSFITKILGKMGIIMTSLNIQMGRHSTNILVYNNVYMIIKRDPERKMKKSLGYL